MHDEAQPAPEREGRRAAGARAPSSRAGAQARPGRARPDVAPGARPGGDLWPAARQPPAIGRLPRRARRAAAHPRLSRGPGRGADPGADPGHRPRHQPGDGDHGRLRGCQGGDQRARRRRRRRPALEGGRGRRVTDAHQPQHARPLRREHRRDRTHRPWGGGDAVLRRRQPERDHGLLEAGRHGLRHRPRQSPQVVLATSRWGRAGRRPDRGLRPDRAVPSDPANRPPPRRQRPRARIRARLRGPKSIGRLRGFQGNFGVFVRALRVHPQPRSQRSEPRPPKPQC